MKNTSKKLPLIWKILAFLLPMYLVFGPVNPDNENPRSRTFWKYIIAGFVFYLLIFLGLFLADQH